MNSHANGLGKVKILVVGDSGVGKTSLVHLLVHGKILTKSSWTIGCSVDVKVHEYKEGSPGQRPYFVELWDIGGNNSHKAARHLFYAPVHGVILVHDLTNRKSERNLRPWLLEVLLKERPGSTSRDHLADGFDTGGTFAKVYGSKQVPVLVIGTRLDELAGSSSSLLPRNTSIADSCNAQEVYVSCLDVRSLAPGSGNAVKLARFFDKVIEQHLAAETVGRSYLGPGGQIPGYTGLKMRTS